MSTREDLQAAYSAAREAGDRAEQTRLLNALQTLDEPENVLAPKTTEMRGGDSADHR